jgi:protein-tyrosine phosphatase
MGMRLYWVNGPWPGRVALAARPRGEDWLEDEVANWRGVEIDTVLSLLTPEEEKELGLSEEANQVRRMGMEFLSLPIHDRQVPQSESQVKTTLERLDGDLSSGKNVLVHCRQGIGRTGLLAASLLITKGLSAGAAVDTVSAARGMQIPETPEQRQWIDHYAASLAGTK